MVLQVVVKEDTNNVLSRAMDKTVGEIGGFDVKFRFGVPAGKYLTFDGDEVSERSFWEATKALEGMGGQKVEVDFRIFREAAEMLYGGAFVAERYAEIGGFLKKGIQEGAEGFDQTVAGIILKGEDIPAWKLQKDLMRMLELVREGERVVWNSVDVLVVPTVPRPATMEEVSNEPVTVNSMLGMYTNFVNLMDYCAVAVPAPQVDGEVVPRGITIIAQAFRDNVLLQMAHAFEKQSQKNE